MQIQLNGTSHAIADDSSIEALLEELQIAGRLAVEVNREIIPRSQHASHRLQENDAVEIVHAIGGGE